MDERIMKRKWRAGFPFAISSLPTNKFVFLAPPYVPRINWWGEVVGWPPTDESLGWRELWAVENRHTHTFFTLKHTPILGVATANQNIFIPAKSSNSISACFSRNPACTKRSRACTSNKVDSRTSKLVILPKRYSSRAKLA